MIIESKILLELDVPTISGFIYPRELSVDIIRAINNTDIGGVIYSGNNLPNPETIKPIFKVSNAQLMVDESVDPSELIICCDVNIDETQLSPKELQVLHNSDWRLSIVWKGETEDNVVKKYELKYVNIEIIDDMYYTYQDRSEG